MRLKKRGALKQILGRVPTEGQLGKDNKITTSLPGLADPVDHLAEVPLKGSYDRIRLNKSDFHNAIPGGKLTNRLLL